MPGPMPKDPTKRQRRNRAATSAKLDPNAGDSVETPALPERHDEEGQLIPWHAMAVAFWEEAWDSPMAPEFLDSDVPGLLIVCSLVDGFWKGVDQGRVGKELAAEIRLQRQQYGLDPMARRRLQWEVEKTDEAVDRGRKRRRKAAADGPSLPAPADPLAGLR